MKPESFLFNTSRGLIIKEKELLEAISSNRIAGAALDVYEIEPLPKYHPFRSQEKILLTGHIGYVTRENFEKAYGEALENVMAWHTGKPIRVLNAK